MGSRDARILAARRTFCLVLHGGSALFALVAAAGVLGTAQGTRGMPFPTQAAVVGALVGLQFPISVVLRTMVRRSRPNPPLLIGPYMACALAGYGLGFVVPAPAPGTLLYAAVALILATGVVTAIVDARYVKSVPVPPKGERA